MTNVFRIAIVVLFALQCSTPTQERTSVVNFDHLDHLTEEIDLFGEKVNIVHIYSTYPDYEWHAAADSGPEGIACVDDAARAAVVYLRHYELTGKELSLSKAKSLLKFVLRMQAEDGQFYNFIFADHSINREGRTSYKSFGWWAERAVWSMSIGYRIFKEGDPVFAQELMRALEKSFPQIERVLGRYGRLHTVDGRKIPEWMLFQYGDYMSSATSELLIGLCEFYAADPRPEVKLYIERFAEALLYFQAGDFETPPHGVFLSESLHWHDWANCQTQALATAGKILGRDDWVAAAEKEVRGFYSRLLIEGVRRQFTIGDPTSIRVFPQIAYGLRPMVVGALRLAEATGNPDYEKMAGLIASWFFGNNVTGKPLYDPLSGRCYDGITDSTTINLNSGAESTIEAIYAILEVEHNQTAVKYTGFRKTDRKKTSEYSYATFADPKGKELTLVLDFSKAELLLLEGEAGAAYRKLLSSQ